VIAITLYSRPGCHLCGEMKATVDRVVKSMSTPITVEEIDISSDPDLESRYGVEIPVLLVNGKKAAKYRVREDELQRLLTDKAG
jgi:glutaredoxin